MSDSADHVALVTRYLRLVEDRHLDQAGRLLAPEAKITFPGNRRYARLEDQVASSSNRFLSIHKVFDTFDVIERADRTIVYAFGTLEGRSVDGESFSGVRFIDRFELQDDLIVDHRVWNDMAENLLRGRSDD